MIARSHCYIIWTPSLFTCVHILKGYKNYLLELATYTPPIYIYIFFPDWKQTSFSLRRGLCWDQFYLPVYPNAVLGHFRQVAEECNISKPPSVTVSSRQSLCLSSCSASGGNHVLFGKSLQMWIIQQRNSLSFSNSIGHTSHLTSLKCYKII